MYGLICFIFLMINGYAACASGKSDSLLTVLDRIIKDKKSFASARERRLAELNAMLNNTENLESQYRVCDNLYGECKLYNANSALGIVGTKRAIAERLNNRGYVCSAEMNRAEILGVIGMYGEALRIVGAIDKRDLDSSGLSYYYHIHHSLYSLMSENSLAQKEKKDYDSLTARYKDSILQIVGPETAAYFLVKSSMMLRAGRHDEALNLMMQCFERYGGDEQLLGSLAYELSRIYAATGNAKEKKRFLALSAIADLKIGVREYIALRELAVLLYDEGEINRAYSYIRCSMEDASLCGARFRIMEISSSLPRITAAYDKKMKAERAKLLKFIVLVSILSFVLVISLIYIRRQYRKLSLAERSIKKMYEDMKLMNKNLEELNRKLSESNSVKEEYICSVFRLCSVYIDKLEKYRSNINRNMKLNRVDEVEKTTSSSLTTEELKEFFVYFDSIFLKLYPNFINEFNTLLNDGGQILPKTDNILTPELRVYALIRLGITDNGKIAKFLHYSPQTVYNYKLKVRNKLAISKDQFSAAIKNIGKL